MGAYITKNLNTRREGAAKEAPGAPTMLDLTYVGAYVRHYVNVGAYITHSRSFFSFLFLPFNFYSPIDQYIYMLIVLKQEMSGNLS